MQNLIIKCDGISGVGTGGFNKPSLEVELESVDFTDLISEISSNVGVEDLNANVNDDDLIAEMERRGYEVVEQD